MPLALRVALAFSLMYPALSAIQNPYAWIGYIPPFVLDATTSLGISPFIFLHTFGILEIILALWILTNKKILIPTLTTTVILASIIIFNHTQFDILFRDVPILIIAIILATQARREQAE